jgi:hypothetical protein
LRRPRKFSFVLSCQFSVLSSQFPRMRFLTKNCELRTVHCYFEYNSTINCSLMGRFTS